MGVKGGADGFQGVLGVLPAFQVRLRDRLPLAEVPGGLPVGLVGGLHLGDPLLQLGRLLHCRLILRELPGDVPEGSLSRPEIR